MYYHKFCYRLIQVLPKKFKPNIWNLHNIYFKLYEYLDMCDGSEDSFSLIQKWAVQKVALQNHCRFFHTIMIFCKVLIYSLFYLLLVLYFLFNFLAKAINQASFCKLKSYYCLLTLWENAEIKCFVFSRFHQKILLIARK